jgi:HEPN domain-containing protein
MITKEEQIIHWIESAENDLTAAENLMLSKNYDWALFLGHLILEKAFKAIFVSKTENEIPLKFII